MKKLILAFQFSILSTPIFAIDYSHFDDAPIFFLGWGPTIAFAVAAIVLFIIMMAISDNGADANGNHTGLGKISWLITIAWIICVICSYFISIPILIIYFVFIRK